MLSEKPWKLDALVRLLLGIGICVCSVWFLIGLSFLLSGEKKPDENSPLYLVMITAGLDGSILLMVGVFLYKERMTWAQAFGFRTAGLGWALLLAALAVALVWPVAIGLQLASVKALTLINIPTPEQEAVQTIRSTGPGLDRIYLIIFTVLIAPPAEEMLFRGIIYPTIKYNGFPRAAWWVTSAAFGGIHLSASIFLPLTLLALVLTFLYEKTDNLLAPIFAHSAFNAVNLVILFRSAHE
jgi:membrane protease YdiL (CAAX protease family)